MLLLLCIVINALIGVVFKLYNKYDVQTLPAIVVNYYVCVTTSMVVTGRATINVDTLGQPYLVYAMLLGLTFILVFDVVARTVGSFGIVVASVFQKMSLIAPTVVAIVWFSEGLTVIKGAGIIAALLSILLITEITKVGVKGSHSWRDWTLPILTLIGSSIIDVGLFLVQAKGIADGGDIGFVATLFGTAALMGTLLLTVKIIKGDNTIGIKEVIGGIVLGVPNFFSIYLLLLLLSKGWDGSAIFPINNVGILAMSAIFGFVLFKEKITAGKVLGVLVSIIAIGLIAYG